MWRMDVFLIKMDFCNRQNPSFSYIFYTYVDSKFVNKLNNLQTTKKKLNSIYFE